MINLSLTDLVDISSKNGMSKYRNVMKVKKRPAYHPAFDYYKKLREHLIDIHSGNYDKSSFLPALELTFDNKKHENYNRIIDGYKKFWGNKNFEWFEPPHGVWIEQDVNVKLNPELGLLIDGIPHVVKLYFKNDKLTKMRTEISLFLLHQMLPAQHNSKNIIYSILDIRNSRLIKTSTFNEEILFALGGEASYISSIWDSVE